jgi:hypothetical protein
MIDRRKLKRIVKRAFSGDADPLAARAEIARQIAEKRAGALLHVYEWSRDCDQCEGDSVNTIPANVPAFIRFLDGFEAGLEGPGRVEIITAAEADEFVAEFRDRRAEQYGY